MGSLLGWYRVAPVSPDCRYELKLESNRMGHGENLAVHQ